MGTLAKGRATAQLAILLAAALLTADCAHGRLIIEDEDLAAWMVTHNEFAKPPDDQVTPEEWDRKYHRDGVLFQFGDYVDVGDIFGSISFERGGASVRELGRDDFIWINIEAEDPDRPITSMEWSHLKSLYPDPDPNHGTKCDAIEAAAAAGQISGTCIRWRSLSGWFTPSAVMTYWQGPRGYRLRVVPPAAGRHPQHIFAFKDPVKISIHKDGAFAENLDGIDIIRIKIKIPTEVQGEEAAQPPEHGGYHSPPWEP